MQGNRRADDSDSGVLTMPTRFLRGAFREVPRDFGPLMGFDPDRPFRTFEPPPRRRARQRRTQLLFVEQTGTRWVVKSYAETGDAEGEAARRVRRELDGIAAFRATGTAALEPAIWPQDLLLLEIDGAKVELRNSLVFPFTATPTLYDAVAAAEDPKPLLAEAASRIRARHEAAVSLDAIHSDGSAHNVFVDWTWFDFCEPHDGADLAEAKGLEILRFLGSVVEVTRAGRARERVAAFCEAYGDRSVLALALEKARMARRRMRMRSWSRMLGRPDKLVRFWLGDTRHFRRVRTWDALDSALRR